ncbi:MAG: CapA family protein, partial [Gemmatimonadales bacterium]
APPVPAAPRAPPLEEVLELAGPEASRPAPVRVCAGGDVMLGSDLDSGWALHAAQPLGRSVNRLPDPEELLRPLAPLVEDAQILLLNVEGAIGEGPVPRKCRRGSTSCYAFRQPPPAAAALASLPAKRVVGNLANNHALDAGPEGLEATVAHLTGAGVQVTGLDTVPTIVVTEGGDSVAFLGYSTARAGPDPRDLPAVRRHVARAKEITPRVVVTMHMGAEGAGAQRTLDTSETFLGEDRGNVVAFARAAVAVGASFVVGHGPHVMRAGEWVGDALILYSLGNLLTYGPFRLSDPLNRGAIACVDLDPAGRVANALLRSTWQRPPGLIEPDPTGRAAWLVDSLSRLDFPESGVKLRGEARIER